MNLTKFSPSRSHFGIIFDIYIYIYIYMYVCMYVCVYIHVDIWNDNLLQKSEAAPTRAMTIARPNLAVAKLGRGNVMIWRRLDCL